MSFALGEIGMTMQDFCDLSLNEYHLKVKGYQMQEAHKWDKVRHIMLFQVLTAGGKSKVRSVQDVFSIPLLDKGKRTGKNAMMLRHLERAVENAGNEDEKMRAALRLAEYQQNYL